MRLAHQEGVQRHATHQRPAVALAVGELLVKAIGDHGGELAIAGAPVDEGRDVVELHGRVGHAHDGPPIGAEPLGLFVKEPVHLVGVAGLEQQLGRFGALRNERAQPAFGGLAFFLDEAIAHLLQHGALGGFVHVDLALGVGAAMADKLVAALAERHQHLGANVVHAGVGQNGQRNLVAVEQLQNAPNAHAIAVVAVGKAPVKGCCRQRGEVGAGVAAKFKSLDVQRKVHRQLGAIGPAVGGALGQL